MLVKSGQSTLLKKCSLSARMVAAVPAITSGRVGPLAAVVGQRGEVAHVVEVRVGDHHRVEGICSSRVSMAVVAPASRASRPSTRKLVVRCCAVSPPWQPSTLSSIA
jgi:hypothetical protein